MGCMMGLPMRPRLPLALGLVALGLALGGCGAVESLKDPETATDAQAAVVEDPQVVETAAVVAEEPPAETAVEPAPVETVAEEPAADNAGAWREIDTGVQRFAGKLDAATQAVASCQTDAAAGEDFAACQGVAFEAIAAAGDELVAIVDGAAPRTGGDCRSALDALRAATSEMSADHRAAIDITDLTGLETAYAEIAADAGAYADAAMTAAGACAG